VDYYYYRAVQQEQGAYQSTFKTETDISLIRFITSNLKKSDER